MRDSLFRPIAMGDLRLPNRIVMAPMSRHRADALTHEPGDLVAEYYEQRASAGLLVSEGLLVGPGSHCGVRLPGLYTGGQVQGWRKVTDRVHAAGGRIIAQILHSGRISHPSLNGGDHPLAPSAIAPGRMIFTAEGPVPAPTPAAMTTAEVRQAVEDFAKAAENAIEAGFDGVQLHAANGYLVQQFLTASANLRTDAYGGNLEGRARFLFETLDAIVDRIGASRLGVRISPNLDAYAGIVRTSETLSEYLEIVRRLNPYDLAFLEVAGHVIGEEDAGERLTLATVQAFRDHFDGVLMMNYALSRDGAAAAIRDGLGHLAAFGTAFIANPDLVERFRRGLPLATPDSETFFKGEARGYVDYPAATVRSEAA